MIHLDTSLQIDAVTGSRRSATHLRRVIERGERMAASTLVLYEWLRGPRSAEEIADQEALFPAADAVPFGPAEAALAAELSRRIKRPRGREIDLAIAACAIRNDAELWTLNREDFADIHALKLYSSLP